MHFCCTIVRASAADGMQLIFEGCGELKMMKQEALLGSEMSRHCDKAIVILY